MLRVFCTNVVGRLHISVNCYAHGDLAGHTVWSQSVGVGSEGPEDELRGLAYGLQRCLRQWEQGGFNFTDDCYETFAWTRPDPDGRGLVGSLDDPPMTEPL